MTEHSAARSKKSEPELPSRQRMTADHRIRRNPSTDQKRDRRMMARQAMVEIEWDRFYTRITESTSFTGATIYNVQILPRDENAAGFGVWETVQSYLTREEAEGRIGKNSLRIKATDDGGAVDSEVLETESDQADVLVAARQAILGGKTAAAKLASADYDSGYANGKRDRDAGNDPGVLQVSSEMSDYVRGYWDGYGLKERTASAAILTKTAARTAQFLDLTCRSCGTTFSSLGYSKEVEPGRLVPCCPTCNEYAKTKAEFDRKFQRHEPPPARRDPLLYSHASKTATPNRGHKLMTAEITRKIPPLYSQDGKGKGATIYVKFFGIMKASGWTWYATEYDPDEGIFFGMVVSPMTPQGELGYFSLAELEDMSAMGGSLPLIERDLYFGEGHTLEDVTLGHTSSRKTGYTRAQHQELTLLYFHLTGSHLGADHRPEVIAVALDNLSVNESAKQLAQRAGHGPYSVHDLLQAKDKMSRSSSKHTAASSEQEIGNRLKDWVLGNPNCTHQNIVATPRSIMPFECADCGYGMTRQDFDAHRGQSSMFASRRQAAEQIADEDEGGLPTDPTWLDNEGQWQADAPQGKSGARSDYAHWNEDADYMWWSEEGKHASEPEEFDEGDFYEPDDFDEDPEDVADRQEDWAGRGEFGDYERRQMGIGASKSAAFGYSDAYNAGFEGGFTDGVWDNTMNTNADYEDGWNAGSDAARVEYERERSTQIDVAVYGPEGPTWQDRHDRSMDLLDQLGPAYYSSLHTAASGGLAAVEQYVEQTWAGSLVMKSYPDLIINIASDLGVWVMEAFDTFWAENMPLAENPTEVWQSLRKDLTREEAMTLITGDVNTIFTTGPIYLGSKQASDDPFEDYEAWQDSAEDRAYDKLVEESLDADMDVRDYRERFGHLAAMPRTAKKAHGLTPESDLFI